MSTEAGESEATVSRSLGWFDYEEPRVKQREEPVASPFLCSSCLLAVGRQGLGPGSSPGGVDRPDLTDQGMRPKLL